MLGEYAERDVFDDRVGWVVLCINSVAERGYGNVVPVKTLTLDEVDLQ